MAISSLPPSVRAACGFSRQIGIALRIGLNLDMTLRDPERKFSSFEKLSVVIGRASNGT